MGGNKKKSWKMKEKWYKGGKKTNKEIKEEKKGKSEGGERGGGEVHDVFEYWGLILLRS